MRIPASEQRQLLDLQHLDRDSAKAVHESQNLAIEKEARSLENRRRTLHVEAVRMKTEAADFGRQAKRIDEDLQRVRARRDRNAEMANSGVDARVQRELQHESDSLDRRQRELEDAEIAFLERQEEAVDESATLAEQAVEVAEEVASVAEQATADREALDTKVATIKSDRAKIVADLPAALISRYEESRSERGVGVAVLEAGHCSACRIDMAPEEVARLRAADEDQVEFCEECGCLLLRD